MSTDYLKTTPEQEFRSAVREAIAAGLNRERLRVLLSEELALGELAEEDRAVRQRIGDAAEALPVDAGEDQE